MNGNRRKVRDFVYHKQTTGPLAQTKLLYVKQLEHCAKSYLSHKNLFVTPNRVRRTLFLIVHIV